MIPHHSQAVEMVDILLAKPDVDPRVATLAEQVWQEDASAILAVGGGQQRLAPTGCLQLGHEVAPAAQRVASIVAQSAP